MGSENTFKSYTKDQGAAYARNRPKYHPDLIQLIIDHHTSTGGELNTILDVGCGPGTSIRELAPRFEHANGIDPSKGMIDEALYIGGTSSTSEPIRFEISTAEELGSQLSPPIKESTVDLITASTAAHWFDMARFWPRAAEILKPGGTVALWCAGPMKLDPSVPNAAAIEEALNKIEERELKQFFEPGNWLARNLYAELVLPWTLEPPMAEFDEATFVRKIWDPENSEGFYVGGALDIDLNTMEKMLSTASPVQRWRDANPDAVKTGGDVVSRMRNEVERLLHAAGVGPGEEIVKAVTTGVLLMVKKKA
jgi:SAM-dependent methyltransferase